MKKSLLLFSLFTVFSMTSYAQLKVGARAGINLSKYDSGIENGSFDKDSESLMGFHAGIILDADVKIFALQTGILFTQKGDMSKNNASERETRINYLEVPLNVRWKFGVAKNNVFVTMGPYFAVAISGEEKFSGNLSGKSKISLGKDEDDAITASDYGLNIGAGIEIMGKVMLSGQYGIGLANVNSATDAESANRVLSFSATVFF